MQQELKVAKECQSDVISFDLQQALPTPNFSVGPAFYLRKLWTYNCGKNYNYFKIEIIHNKTIFN